jgi:hypothetical protein
MRKSLTAIFITITLMFAIVDIGHATETRRRQPSKTKTGLKIGAGAGIGAGLGALIGGKRGAAAGALIGGGAMAGHSIAKRDSGYGRRTRMIGTIATGTAVGTGVGAAAGGGKGAAIGALVGGGASTVYALTRKDLKKPQYESRGYESRGYESRSSSSQQRTVYTTANGAVIPVNSSRQVSNDDPYYRLSGPEGANVGSLLANGSGSIY